MRFLDDFLRGESEDMLSTSRPVVPEYQYATPMGAQRDAYRLLSTTDHGVTRS